MVSDVVWNDSLVETATVFNCGVIDIVATAVDGGVLVVVEVVVVTAFAVVVVSVDALVLIVVVTAILVIAVGVIFLVERGPTDHKQFK